MRRAFWVSITLALAAFVLLPLPGLSQDLSTRIQRQQSKVQSKRQHEGVLTSTISSFNNRISGLQGSIRGLQDRENRIQVTLAAKRNELTEIQNRLQVARDRLVRLRQDHARRELYRAQCNCGYWHGLFGGLYLNYLRDAIYRHLIEAEAHAERVLGIGDKPLVVEADIDADLQPELLLETPEAAAYVKPDWGGGVFELDYRPRRFNLLNVLGRRAEGYHARLLEAARAEQRVDGQRWLRGSL